jgi:hypothetical protein
MFAAPIEAANGSVVQEMMMQYLSVLSILLSVSHQSRR